MANKSFYDEKDIPQFQEDVCKITCILKGKCIEEEKNNHWYLMCPHYHQWKCGYEDSFVVTQCRWQAEHPKEVEKEKEKNKELSKKLKDEKRKKK